KFSKPSPPTNCTSRRSPLTTASCSPPPAIRAPANSSISATKRSCCRRKKPSSKKRAARWRDRESWAILRSKRFRGPILNLDRFIPAAAGPPMKPGKFTHSIAVLMSSITALFTHGAHGALPPSKVKLSRKSHAPKDDNLHKVDPISYSTAPNSAPPFNLPGERFPWKKEIVTTVFWIGEKPTANNPVPNRSSSWDASWTRNYGGYDDPEKSHRHDFAPVKF